MSVAEPDDKTPESPSTSETPASPEPQKAPESAPAPSAAEKKPDSPAKPASNRASLIAQLTAEKTKQTSAADDATSETEEEPAETATPDEDTPEAVTETTEEPAAKADDSEAPVDDSNEVFSEAELKGYKPRTAARIRSLLEERKMTEPITKFGAAILEDIDGKIPPQEFHRWAKLGIEIQTADPAVAAEKLVKMAENLGYKPQVAPTLDEEWLMEQVVSGEISPAGAKALRAKLKEAAPKQTSTTPAERTQAPRPQVDQGPQRAEIDKATNEMKAVAESYKTRHPADFDTLHKRAVEKLKAHKGTHPSAWPGLFKEIFERVIAEAKKPQSATKPPLRPGTTTSPTQTQFKTERERAINRFTK